MELKFECVEKISQGVNWFPELLDLKPENHDCNLNQIRHLEFQNCN